ncbi:Histidine kinase [Candidatus Methylobacter favarea]|uniref:Histidine kinase n=1 Tax=Candidatus Methylobacter favarea TaxID=2707345 RepID=A0A8S0X895_9GAMM|nr:HDOD domain-containing protein [Candidatus Methylobacter favarea]CAA9890880.1 Histidine kinase [Candidatus Methylobacter favarea]
MSFLNPFFKGKKNVSSICSLVPEKISVELLKELIPIRNFSNEKLLAFATNHSSEVFPAQTTLFKLGSRADSALYLLRGIITLSDDSGTSYEVDAGTAKAKFPLSSGALHTTTAIAKTDVSILRVSQKIMIAKTAPSSPLSELNIPDYLNDNRLLQTFSQYYTSEELELPSLPDIAFKLRKAMQQDIGIADAVKIIQLDPIISAKLIEVANCALYMSAVPAKSCFTAVSRIGLNAVRNLVIGLSINHIFKSNSPLIKRQLDRIWKQSLYISTLSYVLAAVTRQANPEEALLAGLICDIGAVPFLNYAANLPKDYYSESDIALALHHVKGPIGYKILLDWGFSEEFVKIPIFSQDWYQNSSEELNLTDIVVLSRLHSYIGQADRSELPAITSIPAASKLKNFSLSPEHSLNLLHEAKQQINDALKAFHS